jgi:uncharacterized protein YbbK (DUF523 family)
MRNPYYNVAKSLNANTNSFLDQTLTICSRWNPVSSCALFCRLLSEKQCSCGYAEVKSGSESSKRAQHKSHGKKTHTK